MKCNKVDELFKKFEMAKLISSTVCTVCLKISALSICKVQWII